MKIVRPLDEITRKETKWSWGEKQQKAFEELKRKIYNRASLGNTRFCYGRSIVDEV